MLYNLRKNDLEHTEVHDGRCEFKKMDLRSTSVAAVNNNNVCKLVRIVLLCTLT